MKLRYHLMLMGLVLLSMLALYRPLTSYSSYMGKVQNTNHFSIAPVKQADLRLEWCDIP